MTSNETGGEKGVFCFILMIVTVFSFWIVHVRLTDLETRVLLLGKESKEKPSDK